MSLIFLAILAIWGASMSYSSIDNIVAKDGIVIVGAKWCRFCDLAKMKLNRMRIPYTEIDIDENPEAMSYLRSKRGKTSIPGVFLCGRYSGGYTELAKDLASLYGKI
jgi:glutaredoxin 3